MSALIFEVEVQGHYEFIEGIDEFQMALAPEVASRLMGWLSKVERLAWQKAAVRTGYMRSTIYSKVAIEIASVIAEIGAAAFYSGYVELGTRFMAAQPFLYPSIQEFLPLLDMLMYEALDAAGWRAGLK